jgi:hypothetical protein
MTQVDLIDRSVEKTHIWLNELAGERSRTAGRPTASCGRSSTPCGIG